MKLVIAYTIPAKLQALVPILEINSIHTAEQIHIVVPFRHFVAFFTAIPQKQLLLSWARKKVIKSRSPKCFFKLSQWNSTVSTSFPLLFFHTVLVKLLTTDRKGHIVFTRPLHFCYIILGTGDFKGIYLNKDTIVLAAVSTQFVFPKCRDYLGN